MSCHIRCEVSETTAHLTPASVWKHGEIFAFVSEALTEGKFMRLHFQNGTYDTRSIILCDTVLCDTGFSTVQSRTLVPTLRRHYNIHHPGRRVGTCLSLIYQVHNVKFLRNVHDFYHNTRCHIPEDSCLYSTRWVSQISPEDVPFAPEQCQIACCWATIYGAVLTARTANVPTYFGHDPLRLYLITFDTFIITVIKYPGHVRYDHS